MKLRREPAVLINECGDYCLYPHVPTEFSDWEHLTLSGGKELDRALRWFNKKLAKYVSSRQSLDVETAAMLSMAEFYRNERFLRDPELFFRAPTAAPHVRIMRPHKLGYGEVVDVAFRSNYEPIYKPFQREYQRYMRNQTAYARMWRHPPGKSLGQVVAIHGWCMGDQRVNALALLPGVFFRLGLDVVLYELPYHGRRLPAGRTSVESLFPSLHFARTNEAVAQAIHDLRSLQLWLRGKYDLPLGTIGMSLGGYAAALWASLDKLDFAIPMVPLVSMADTAWEALVRHQDEYTRSEQEILANIDAKLLRNVYELHNPLRFAPQVPEHARMIIAATGDTIIPVSQPQALWEHWGQPQIHWVEGGHSTELTKTAVFNEVQEFLVSLGLGRSELISIPAESA